MPRLHSIMLLTALLMFSGCSMLHRTRAASTPPPAATPSMSAPVPAPAGTAALGSGIDTEYEDKSVRPQDDFYRYLNGKWLDEFQIPADKGIYVSFTAVDDRTQEQLHSIVDALASYESAGGDADAKKLADLYASFMDESRLDALGIEPLKPMLAAVDHLRSKKQIPALIARLNQEGINAPYDVGVSPDPKDSTRYAVTVGQSGLGMPDRDYYLKDDPKLKSVREQYLKHIETMLELAGERRVAQQARNILKLETVLAERQWTRVENRDPIKTYNKYAITDLEQLTPGFDWHAYLTDTHFAGKIDYLIVEQPSYLKGLDHAIAHTPLPIWRSYFRWHVLTSAAPFLSRPFVDEQFAFAGTIVRGIPENRPRWKRGVALLNEALGEALGKLYVERYFPPPYKERMQGLVHQLIVAYGRDIDRLDWMSAATRRGAHEKLAKLVTKIGYPDKWRDYGALAIEREDLWGNVVRATQFEFQRDVAKLGKPIDRQEWLMTPQTVNAYYNPLMNEIVFPAAILQPPFFNAHADDAVNYGAIGAIIGHEISHAFDDQGSHFDAEGNLHDWFAPEDHAKFAAKTQALVAQYDAYSPVPGFHVNGRLTLGENIADNAGLAIAYQAYHLSLEGHGAPVIDGLSGDQRFYLGFAQVWRGKAREAEAVQRIKTDPHSPPAVRGTAPLRNQPGFYQAFDVKPGDQMYLPPAERVIIW